MTSKSMVAALNGQVKAELYASYLYYSMAVYCERQNLFGFANWMHVQASEEREHAERIVKFLQDIGETVVLEAIEKPPSEFGSPKNVFEKALEHERKVTAMIHKLMDQAVAEKDYRSQGMLQWFVNEQIEEEEQTAAVVARIEQVEERMSGIHWIDKMLGERKED